MAINKNRTYSSDGGYAASNKQKEYVPKSVAKKASLMLREQERQRLIEAAKRLDAQTRGAAAEGNNGFGTVNNRQTFPEVIAANRNAGAGVLFSADLFLVEHGFHFVPNICKESPEKPAFIITKYMD